jgi:DNA-binding response OmpR family regulator
MNVLVVESEDWLRERIIPWIREAGFEVLACPGPQGPDFDCAGASRYGCPLGESADLIVLDLELESDLLVCGVAAWELLHYYRSLDKPVVALTGFGDAIRPLPGDRLAVLRRLPDRDELVEAIRVLLLTKELHPTAESESAPDVLVPGGYPPGRSVRSDRSSP